MWDRARIEAAAAAAKADPTKSGELLAACAPLIEMRCPASMFDGTLCEPAEAPGLAAPKILRALRWWDPARMPFSMVVWRFARQWVFTRIPHRSPCTSLDQPLGDDETGDTLADMVADETASDPSAVEYPVPLHILKPRTREVIRRYYGLDGSPSHTLTQIGPTHQAAKNLLRNGLKKLRRAMAA